MHFIPLEGQVDEMCITWELKNSNKKKKYPKSQHVYRVKFAYEYGRVSYNGRISLPNLYVEPYSY